MDVTLIALACPREAIRQLRAGSDREGGARCLIGMECPFHSSPQGPVAMRMAPLSTPGTWDSSKMSTLGLAFLSQSAKTLLPSADATHRLRFSEQRGMLT